MKKIKTAYTGNLCDVCVKECKVEGDGTSVRYCGEFKEVDDEPKP